MMHLLRSLFFLLAQWNTSRENLTRLPMQSPVILYSVPAGSPGGRGAANPTASGSEWNDLTGPLQTGGTSQLGIAPATTRTYRTGVMCYKSFCQQLSLEVTPALEELLLFVTELTQSRAVSTIRCYLATSISLPALPTPWKGNYACNQGHPTHQAYHPGHITPLVLREI